MEKAAQDNQFYCYWSAFGGNITGSIATFFSSTKASRPTFYYT